jgi:hypothetical protein
MLVKEVRMPKPIAHRLTTLPKLSKTALRELWKQLFNAVPPPQLRRCLSFSIHLAARKSSSMSSIVEQIPLELVPVKSANVASPTQEARWRT